MVLPSAGISVLTGCTIPRPLVSFSHFGFMYLSIYTLVLKMAFGSIVGVSRAFRFAEAPVELVGALVELPGYYSNWLLCFLRHSLLMGIYLAHTVPIEMRQTWFGHSYCRQLLLM